VDRTSGRLTPLISHRVTARGVETLRREGLMPFVDGPVGVCSSPVTVVATFVVWLLRNRPLPPARAPRERSQYRSRGAGSGGAGSAGVETRHRPDEDALGDDWGPGAAGPRPPVRL